MGLQRFNRRVSVPELKFKRQSSPTRYNGNVAVRVAQAVFDTAGVDSSSVSNKTIAAHGLGVYLPDNAVVIDAWIDVITTFTSATDAATIALKIQTANDTVSAIAISNASNVWDAGLHGSVIGSFALDGNALTAIAMAAAKAASMIKLTAEREITATVAVEALTAGKAVINVVYILGD